MGLANNSFVSSPTSTGGGAGTGRPRPPIRVPLASESTLVPVNLKAIPTSGVAEHDTFVFRKDSAGLGVPRGSLGKLNSFSNQATQHGMASTNISYGDGAQRAGAGSAEHSSYSGSASS